MAADLPKSRNSLAVSRRSTFVSGLDASLCLRLRVRKRCFRGRIGWWLREAIPGRSRSQRAGCVQSFNARRVLSGVELVHKIIKGQFGLPESFATDPFHVWYNVLAA